MQKFVLLFLWTPLAALGSALYSFQEPVANRGTIGFTYMAADYLTEPRNYVSAGMLTSCDTSGMPGWVCEGVWLNQTNYSGLSAVQISLTLRYAAGLPGDAFNTDEIDDSFSPVRLNQAGIYRSFLNPRATFTIADPPTSRLETAAVPEPATWILLAGAGLVLILAGVWRKRKTSGKLIKNS